MKKNLLLLVVMGATMLLSSCILSKTPNQTEVTIHADDLMTFSVKIFPTWNASEVKWYLDDDPYPIVKGTQFIYAPIPWDVGAHTLKVVDGSSDYTWNITVLESLFVKPEDFGIEEAKEALYAAYAGIGYNTTNGNRYDHELLYNMMFVDPNYLVVSLTTNCIFNNGADALISKIAQYFLGLKVTFSYSDDSGSFKLILQQTSAGRFQGSLYADFNANGYTFYDCYVGCPTFYGHSGVYDFVATVTGKLKATTNPLEITELSFDSVSINAKDTLRASYALGDNGYDIHFDNWEISYQGTNPMNLYVIPVVIGSEPAGADVRDYQVNGKFYIDDTVNTDEYWYREFHYVQNETDGTKTITVSGDMSPPSLAGGLLEIVTSESIVIDSDGTWIFGRLSIPCKNSISRINIDFNNGAATFTGTGAFSGLNETVDNWQNSLDPYLP